MSYDLYLEWDYVNRHDGGSDTYESYSLLSSDGKPYTATRNSVIERFRQRNGGIPASFRVTYSGANFQAVNTLGFNYHSTPADHSASKLYIWPDTDTGYTSGRTANSRTRSYSWNGSYYFRFSERVDMSVNTNVLYGHNNYFSLYSTDITGSQDILSNSKEDALSAAIYATARYNISSTSSLSARLYAGDDDNTIGYAGSSVFTTDYNGFETGGTIAYDATLPINLRLHADAGVTWNRSDVNGLHDYTLRPTANINASYAPENNKHQLNLMANYAQSSPGISAKTPNEIQYNEFLYATGNPLLKNVSQLNSWISYMWLPSNTFNAGLVAQYYAAFKCCLEHYSHYEDGSALLRSYINDGNFQQWNVVLQANYRPINSLRFTAMAVYNTSKRTSAEVNRTIHAFYGNLSVQYDIKQFWVSAKAYLPETSLTSINASKIKTPFCYVLSAGWSNGRLNVNISANNIFDKHWRTGNTEMSMPLYGYSSVQYGNFTYRDISLTVSYTIDYGKKIRHDNELGRQQDSKSGILK